MGKRTKKIIKKKKNEDSKMEIFEDIFRIPLHKFNMSFIIPQTKIENSQETIIREKKMIRQQKRDGKYVAIEEVCLPHDKTNLETLLPMIDYLDISNIKIVEKRTRIEKKNVEGIKKNEEEEKLENSQQNKKKITTQKKKKKKKKKKS